MKRRRMVKPDVILAPLQRAEMELAQAPVELDLLFFARWCKITQEQCLETQQHLEALKCAGQGLWGCYAQQPGLVLVRTAISIPFSYLFATIDKNIDLLLAYYPTCTAALYEARQLQQRRDMDRALLYLTKHVRDILGESKQWQEHVVFFRQREGVRI
jgi:hypothetical protein